MFVFLGFMEIHVCYTPGFEQCSQMWSVERNQLKNPHSLMILAEDGEGSTLHEITAPKGLTDVTVV